MQLVFTFYESNMKLRTLKLEAHRIFKLRRQRFCITLVMAAIVYDDDQPSTELSLFPDDLFLMTNHFSGSNPCDGGTVDTQKDSFANISVSSEEFQSTKPEGIKNDTSNKMVSFDVDVGNKMTSYMRIMLVGADDLSAEKQRSEGCSGYDSHLQIKES
ncbi:hypothetical protein V6N13_065075 [Hibiscus sabdariffa]